MTDTPTNRPSNAQSVSTAQSAALNGLGCLGVLLGSIALFIIGVVGIGVGVWGLLVDNPWLIGLGLGMATTGLSVGFFALGLDIDDVLSGTVGSGSTGLLGWVSARWLLLLSLVFAVVANGLVLARSGQGWQAWVAAYAVPLPLLAALLIWMIRTKPSIDDLL